MTTDVPTAVSKRAPSFCPVYIISKGKISTVRSATTPIPKSAVPVAMPMIAPPTPSRNQRFQPQYAMRPQSPERSDPQNSRQYPPRPVADRNTAYGMRLGLDDEQEMISPFNRRGHKAYESLVPGGYQILMQEAASHHPYLEEEEEDKKSIDMSSPLDHYSFSSQSSGVDLSSSRF